MNVSQIKDFVMFQTNNDAGDAGEFEPFLMDYINEGYDRLVWAHARRHLEKDSEYPPLADDTDEPKLPSFAHLGIANWAAWCVYRNGNPAKQSRGHQFRLAAEETLAGIRADVNATHFVNVPR